MDQLAKISRHSEIALNCDDIVIMDMIRNSKDVEIYGVAQIIKVAKNCGNAENHKVAEIFESISSH